MAYVDVYVNFLWDIRKEREGDIKNLDFVLGQEHVGDPVTNGVDMVTPVTSHRSILHVVLPYVKTHISEYVMCHTSKRIV